MRDPVALCQILVFAHQFLESCDAFAQLVHGHPAFAVNQVLQLQRLVLQEAGGLRAYLAVDGVCRECALELALRARRTHLLEQELVSLPALARLHRPQVPAAVNVLAVHVLQLLHRAEGGLERPRVARGGPEAPCVLHRGHHAACVLAVGLEVLCVSL